MSVSNERYERKKHRLGFLKDLITPGAYDVFGDGDYGLWTSSHRILTLHI